MDQKLSYPTLQAFVRSVFFAMGCPSADAETATASLLAADLRGIDSHGVARLSGYVRLWEAGRVNAQPNIQVVHESPSTAVVDGDAGLGLVVAPWAMQVAIRKAQTAGTGWVAVRHSNHFGIAAHHAMQALGHGMIGMVMTNASALVAPTFSRERLLGTNPICVAIPAGEEPPFVADMATTTAANGKLEIHSRKGIPTPTGWIQDAAGHSTTDPDALKAGGALLPLGGDCAHGSHKGYALGAIVDIWSGVLAGANFGPWVPPFPAYVPMPEGQPGKGLGHFLGAMRVDAFRSEEAFRADMDRWIRRFRSAQTVEGQEKVLIPGDPEREMEAIRLVNGIPLPSSIIEDLQRTGAAFGIEWA